MLLAINAHTHKLHAPQPVNNNINSATKPQRLTDKHSVWDFNRRELRVRRREICGQHSTACSGIDNKPIYSITLTYSGDPKPKL